jgi:hypothetical protein
MVGRSPTQRSKGLPPPPPMDYVQPLASQGCTTCGAVDIVHTPSTLCKAALRAGLHYVRGSASQLLGVGLGVSPPKSIFEKMDFPTQAPAPHVVQPTESKVGPGAVDIIHRRGCATPSTKCKGCTVPQPCFPLPEGCTTCGDAEQGAHPV